MCELAFRGDFFAISRKHSKSLESELQDVLAVGVDRGQRQFETDARPGDAWRNHSLADTQAKELIYDALVPGGD